MKDSKTQNADIQGKAYRETAKTKTKRKRYPNKSNRSTRIAVDQKKTRNLEMKCHAKICFVVKFVKFLLKMGA